MPAKSESGKSTLTAALVRSGWDYVSDEFAVLDPTDGSLAPYARPIQLDPGSYGVFPEIGAVKGRSVSDVQWHIDPTELGGCVATAPPAPTHLLFPRYERDASTELLTVSKGQALARMIGLSMSLHLHSRQGFALLGHVARRCPAVELVSGNSCEQVEAIDEWIQQ